MIVYGYVWMFTVFILFLASMYGIYSRNLFQAPPFLALVPALILAFWVRVEAYGLFQNIMRFQELEGVVLLGAMVFGTLFLTALVFGILAVLNLIYPRTLGAGDVFCLACFGGFGLSLVALLYGMVSVLLREAGPVGGSL